jgi:hypothetical protein
MNGSPDFWECRYDFPAVTDRYVSYDGVYPSEQRTLFLRRI